MTTNPVPTELNWVEVQANCVLPKALAKLQYGVQKDVEARVAIITEQQRKNALGFSCEVLGPDSFEVHRSGAGLVSKVTFVLGETGIVVKDVMGIEILTASVSVKDDGRCVLAVGDAQLEYWQVRRRALDKLFFDLRA